MIQKPFANINHFSLAHGTAWTSVGSFFPRPPLRFEGVISPSSSPPPLTPPCDKKGEDDDEEGGGGRGGRGASSVLTASSFDGTPPTRLRCTVGGGFIMGWLW